MANVREAIMALSPRVSAMNNPSILSADAPVPSASPAAAPAQPRARGGARPGSAAFDACQVGVVLRAVLFVEAGVAGGTLVLPPAPAAWLLLAATVTGGALPATLLWLLAACALKRLL